MQELLAHADSLSLTALSEKSRGESIVLTRSLSMRACLFRCTRSIATATTTMTVAPTAAGTAVVDVDDMLVRAETDMSPFGAFFGGDTFTDDALPRVEHRLEPFFPGDEHSVGEVVGEVVGEIVGEVVGEAVGEVVGDAVGAHPNVRLSI
jgi:hypothetical protein